MPSHLENGLPFEDPLSWIPRGLTKLHSIWLTLTYPFASVGRNLSIHCTCRLRRPVAPAIRLGNSVTICKDSWLNVYGPALHRTEPAIVIDDNTWISPRCQISASNRIHLERDVLVAASVLIMDHNHAYEDTALPISKQGITGGGSIRIGQGCVIGQGAAIICPRGELTLGRNCVVGVNSVVTRSFPPYSVAFGNPARVIRQYDTAKKMWVPGSSRPADREPV
jgi:acetyltransferase-like isoleucine patch superfamily enzyme